MAVIIVVEGPSAAGKSTWVRRMGGDHAVAELHGLRPPAAGPSGIAAFWTEQNARRWQAALGIERASGVAVCDTDPLKLHYEYCLARIGVGSSDVLTASVSRCREAIGRHRLGIADLVICEVPGDDVLERRRGADRRRRRRNFDIHRRLGPALVEWYTALGDLDPGRVVWGYPSGLPRAEIRNRYDLDLYDAWMTRLGIVPG